MDEKYTFLMFPAGAVLCLTKKRDEKQLLSMPKQWKIKMSNFVFHKQAQHYKLCRVLMNCFYLYGDLK